MKERKYLRGSKATYQLKNGKNVCDLVKLAKLYAANVGNIPERVGFLHACELRLLAYEFLQLYGHWKKSPKRPAKRGKKRP